MQFQPSRARQRIHPLAAATLILSFLFTGVASAEGGPHANANTPGLSHSQLRDRFRVRGEHTRAPGQALSRLEGLERPYRPEEPPAAEAATPAAAPAQAAADGPAGVLRAVNVPGLFTLRVVQQPASAPFQVDMTPGVATQYGAASAYGVTGLLADNAASGTLFYSLAPGQTVELIYADGSVRRYVVDGVYRYQALSPASPYSDFVDLGTGAQVTAAALFSQMYSGGDKVTFQTCLAEGGLMSWGRLFVTAAPAG